MIITSNERINRINRAIHSRSLLHKEKEKKETKTARRNDDRGRLEGRESRAAPQFYGRISFDCLQNK